MRNQLLSFVSVIAIVTAVPAMAAEIETSSQIDAVTVYPDGATVTRLIRLDLPAVDSRPPLPAPPANLPQIDRRIETLRDQRAALDGDIAAATARRKFAERFAENSPAGLGEKGEA